MSKSQQVRIFWMVFKGLYLILAYVEPAGSLYSNKFHREYTEMMNEIEG